MAYDGSSMDPMAEYASPMYGPGPAPDLGHVDYLDPTATFSRQAAGGSSGGYTPFGAMLLGDTAYNIAVAIAQYIRMLRPMDDR